MKTKFSICAFLLCLIAALSVQSNEVVLVKDEVSEHYSYLPVPSYTEFITCLETAEIPGESKGWLNRSEARKVTNEYPSNDLSVEINQQEHTFHIGDHWRDPNALVISTLNIDDRIFLDDSVIRKVVDPILQNCPAFQSRLKKIRLEQKSGKKRRKKNQPGTLLRISSGT